MKIEKISKLTGIPETEIRNEFGENVHIYKVKPLVVLNHVENFQENVFMQIPPEKTDKSYRYVIQMHIRGKSVHFDLRLERENDLIGWTLLAQLEGLPDKPITTLKEAKEFFEKHKNDFKIDFSTGEFKKKKDKAGRIRPTEIQVIPKAVEPHVWLFDENLNKINQLDYLYLVEGVAPIGTPGSTAEYPGVFLIVDKGYVEYGATKPYLFEYFFNSGILNGRYIIRTLAHFNEEILSPSEAPEEHEIRSAHFWVMIQPEDKRPYVISDRAVKSGYIPDYNYSALPYKIKENIPRQYQYWKEKDIKKRIELRNRLISEVEELEIDLDKLTKMTENSGFGIWRIWWKRTNKEGKPVIVIRYTPSTEYYLLKIADRVFESGYNPLETETFLYPRNIRVDLTKFDTKHKLETGSELNPTKATSAWIEPVIIGTTDILTNSPTFIKFQFKGKLYILYKPEGEEFWLFQESGFPSIEGVDNLKNYK